MKTYLKRMRVLVALLLITLVCQILLIYGYGQQMSDKQNQLNQQQKSECIKP